MNTNEGVFQVYRITNTVEYCGKQEDTERDRIQNEHHEFWLIKRRN